MKRRHIVNAKTIGSTLRRGLAPLMTRDVGALTRKDIVQRIDALEAAGKPGAAQDLRRHSRALLEFAVTRGLVQFNVLAGMRQPRSSRVERLQGGQKGRALTDAEIGAVWASALVLGSFGGLLRLGLLTGLRRSELSGLKWSDIRDDRILIAAERAKTGHEHEVPLTAAMRAVLDAQPRTTSKLVFPGRNNVRLTGWSKLVPRAKSRNRRRLQIARSAPNGADLDVAPWRAGRDRRAVDRPRPPRTDRHLQSGSGMGG